MKHKLIVENPEISPQLGEKLVNSKLPVLVTALVIVEKYSEETTEKTTEPSTEKKKYSEKKTIADIFHSAIEKKEGAVVTFTCGPFPDGQPLPKSWMYTPAAVGCTKQLKAFDKAVIDKTLPVSKVYGVNRWNSDVQFCVMIDKGLVKTEMIASCNELEGKEGYDDLEKELNLTPITVDGEKYIARCTVAMKSDGTTQVFKLENSDPERSISDEEIKTHIESIVNFLGVAPKPEQDEQNTPKLS